MILHLSVGQLLEVKRKILGKQDCFLKGFNELYTIPLYILCSKFLPQSSYKVGVIDYKLSGKLTFQIDKNNTSVM